jgi:adenylate cyclase
LGLGADDYLPKPFSPRELIARVRTRLRAKATTDYLRNQREIIKSTFSRFVAQEIIDLMLQNPEQVTLGGQMRPVTVMFADLEGFTGAAEHEDPVEILEVLNAYHGFLVHIIKQNGGTIDKFLGDGLMALFNAPIDMEDHVYLAVKSALEIKHALLMFHHEFEEKYQLGIHIGIHTGPAVVGNVGAPDLMDYTAVGDTVNLASRLLSVSEGKGIMISEAVKEVVESRVVTEYIGPRTVRGRAGSVVVYQALDFLRS